jgi:tripartite-type tricarboxylate transporter receptor subunit TctC
MYRWPMACRAVRSGMTPAEFKQFVESEIVESARVVKAPGIKAQ